MISLLQVVSCLFLFQQTSSQVAEIPSECHAGDINIAIYPDIIISCPGDAYPRSKSFYWRYLSIRKHLDKINSNPNLNFHRNNLTLGYLLYNTCLNPIAASDIASRVRPAWKIPDLSVFDFCNTIDPLLLDDKLYFIIGSVGPTTSGSTIPISYIQQRHQLFTISPTASSDVFQDRAMHPYVLRLVPPDSLQAALLVDLLLKFNWSYIIVLYDDSAYGRNILNNFYKRIQEVQADICIAVEDALSGVIPNHREKVLANINQHEEAKVIVYLGYWYDWLFTELDHSDRIFIGSDSLITREKFGRSFHGSLLIDFSSNVIPDVIDIFNNLNYGKVFNGSDIDRKFWEKMHNCKFDSSNEQNTSCSHYDEVKEKGEGLMVDSFDKTLDSISIYAQAVDYLLRNECGSHIHNSRARTSCLRGSALQGALFKLNFLNLGGKTVKFTADGYVSSTYTIYQVLETLDLTKAIQQHLSPVATWNEADGLVVDYSKWYWTSNISSSGKQITSRCTRDCLFDEAKIIINRCCWECRKCRGNEIVRNGSACQECPLYYWPDLKTKLTCHPITAQYTDFLSLRYICMSVFGSCGILTTTTTLIFYIHQREHPLIKASSLSLSCFSLVAILMGFGTIFLYGVKPSLLLCSVRNTMYHLASGIPYASLLTKTARVYRIFQASRKGRRLPSFVGIKCVLGAFSSIVIFEVKF